MANKPTPITPIRIAVMIRLLSRKCPVIHAGDKRKLYVKVGKIQGAGWFTRRGVEGDEGMRERRRE